MRLQWSAHAASDLQAISEYIERDRNNETATRVIKTIYDSIRRLPHMPYRGRLGPIENTRQLVVPGLPYIVIYQVLEDRIVILNVVHGAQKRP